MDSITTVRLPEKKIDITVVVPVYNTGKYLRECMDSLLKQENVICEIICVDDCSTDDSRSILNEYAARDERILIESLAENHGQAYARNVGLHKASGKYIYFMDSDDYLLTDDALRRVVEKILLVQCDCLVFDAINVFESDELRMRYDGWTSLTEKAEEGEYEGMFFFTEIMNNDVSLITVWREIWNRDFLINRQLEFREETAPHEDLLFWLESMLHTRIYYWKESLYGYRVRSDSSSMKRYDRKRLFAHFYCFYYGKKAVEKGNVEPCYCRAINEWFARLFREIYENRISVIRGGQDINDIENDNLYIKLEYRHLMLNGYPYIGRFFTPDEYHRLQKARTILIYGAGVMGQNVRCMLNDFGIHNCTFVVTKRDDGMDPIIKEAGEFASIKEDVVVIVGVMKKHRNDVMGNINRIGFSNVISLD